MLGWVIFPLHLATINQSVWWLGFFQPITLSPPLHPSNHVTLQIPFHLHLPPQMKAHQQLHHQFQDFQGILLILLMSMWLPEVPRQPGPTTTAFQTNMRRDRPLQELSWRTTPDAELRCFVTILTILSLGGQKSLLLRPKWYLLCILYSWMVWKGDFHHAK